MFFSNKTNINRIRHNFNSKLNHIIASYCMGGTETSLNPGSTILLQNCKSLMSLEFMEIIMELYSYAMIWRIKWQLGKIFEYFNRIIQARNIAEPSRSFVDFPEKT